MFISTNKNSSNFFFYYFLFSNRCLSLTGLRIERTLSPHLQLFTLIVCRSVVWLHSSLFCLEEYLFGLFEICLSSSWKDWCSWRRSWRRTSTATGSRCQRQARRKTLLPSSISFFFSFVSRFIFSFPFPSCACLLIIPLLFPLLFLLVTLNIAQRQQTRSSTMGWSMWAPTLLPRARVLEGAPYYKHVRRSRVEGPAFFGLPSLWAVFLPLCLLVFKNFFFSYFLSIFCAAKSSFFSSSFLIFSTITLLFVLCTLRQDEKK